ncbi:MAG: hypothetical protein AAFY81_03850, partial [Pseudomonadota bacterium]
SDRQTHLDVRNYVKLEPNSVCFLTLGPHFRLPAYIGARFNLLIRDVYRGLLVGTGPMVDPGFSGRLSVPIHNFTNREYYIKAGEGLVYFEFTKLSWSNPERDFRTPTWLPSALTDQPPFPPSKGNRKELDDYLNLATGGGPPASSIAGTLAELRSEVKKAERWRRIVTLGGIATAAALVFSIITLYSDAQQFVGSAQEALIDDKENTDDRLDALELRQRQLQAPEPDN